MNVNASRWLCRTAFKRCFSSSVRRRIEDPQVPGLYRHPIADMQDHYILSFLPNRGQYQQSITDIGILKGTKISPKTVDVFEDWLPLVHAILSTRIDQSLMLQTMAKARAGDGYLHISDERNPPEANRIPDADDIIASVLVENKAIVPDSYEPMPTYRVVTTDGLMRLNSELQDMLVNGLQLARQLEEEEDS